MHRMIDTIEYPTVAPVAEGTPRPFWSVMIPTYNCAGYLRETLASVLSQDPGPEQMQIEVVDDFSTKDDPQSVAREAGGGRVDFYRHSKNIGAPANFNACLDRSRGRWVHVLHGDDYVLPGFYETLRRAIESHPEVGLVTTRAFHVDVHGGIDTISARLAAYESPSRDPRAMFEGNPICFAAAVVRREGFEALGGFHPSLSHTNDWEMWIRQISERGVLAINQPLACYRTFEGNDTSRLEQTGKQLRDKMALVDVLRAREPQFDDQKMLKALADEAWSRMQMGRSTGNETMSRAYRQVLTDLMSRLGWGYRVRMATRGCRQWLRRILN